MFLFYRKKQLSCKRPCPLRLLRSHRPGCGSQRLLRCRLHPAGRSPNISSLFPPLAAVVAVAPNEGRLWHGGQVSPERVKLIYFVDCSAPLQRAAAA